MPLRRIGITLREMPATPERFARDALDAAWIDWFNRELGDASFVLLPNFAEPEPLLAYVKSLGINALLLSGGEDLGQSPRRDRNEQQLLDLAEAGNWPVLGVCRGMQVLQQRAGGRMRPSPQPIGQAHQVRIAATCAAESGPILVNSWHRWCIHELAADWQALAWAEDGSIEAMRHRQRPWLGLMWHPERDQGAADLCSHWWQPLWQTAQGTDA